MKLGSPAAMSKEPGGPADARSVGLTVEQLEDENARLRDALKTARGVIKIFHGEPAWSEYQHSPEMRQINAALFK